MESCISSILLVLKGFWSQMIRWIAGAKYNISHVRTA